MRLFDFKPAPNPRRVHIFLAEKGIDVPTEQVDLRQLEQFAPGFEKINERHTVPVLELDDGECISETMAICRYFEAVQPEPPLFGVTPGEQGRVEMWNRRIEHNGFMACADALRNSSSRFEGRALPGYRDNMPQIPELAERGRQRVLEFFAWLDRRLENRDFVALDVFSVADITALVTVDFAKGIGIDMPGGLDNIARWHRAVSARPSVAG